MAITDEQIGINQYRPNEIRNGINLRLSIRWFKTRILMVRSPEDVQENTPVLRSECPVSPRKSPSTSISSYRTVLFCSSSGCISPETWYLPNCMGSLSGPAPCRLTDESHEKSEGSLKHVKSLSAPERRIGEEPIQWRGNYWDQTNCNWHFSTLFYESRVYVVKSVTIVTRHIWRHFFVLRE